MDACIVLRTLVQMTVVINRVGFVLLDAWNDHGAVKVRLDEVIPWSYQVLTATEVSLTWSARVFRLQVPGFRSVKRCVSLRVECVHDFFVRKSIDVVAARPDG